MGSYGKTWVWGMWTDRHLGELGWGEGGSGRGREKTAGERREGTPGRLTYKEVSKLSVKKNLHLLLMPMVTEQQKITQARKHRDSNSSTAEGISKQNFRCATKVCKRNWCSQGCIFPPRSVNLLSRSLRNAMQNCCIEFSLWEGFQTSGKKIHWSVSSKIWPMLTCGPLHQLILQGKKSNLVSEGAAAFENRRQTSSINMRINNAVALQPVSSLRQSKHINIFLQ